MHMIEPFSDRTFRWFHYSTESALTAHSGLQAPRCIVPAWTVKPPSAFRWINRIHHYHGTSPAMTVGSAPDSSKREAKEKDFRCCCWCVPRSPGRLQSTASIRNTYACERLGPSKDSIHLAYVDLICCPWKRDTTSPSLLLLKRSLYILSPGLSTKRAIFTYR